MPGEKQFKGRRVYPGIQFGGITISPSGESMAVGVGDSCSHWQSGSRGQTGRGAKL